MIIKAPPIKKKDKLIHKIGVRHNSKCWTICGKLYDGNKLKVVFGEDDITDKKQKCKKCFR